MIFELIRSWRTPASRAARQLGYLYESIAIEERFRRRRQSWMSHIENCFEVTLKEFSASGARTIAILGSGPLYEVPMDKLIEIADKIILVDIVHPLKVRRRYRNHPKVKLIEHDLSGVSEAMLSFSGGVLPRPEASPLPDAGFILSANCLSQLPHKPRQKAESYGLTAEQLDRFCEEISAHHLAQIRELGKPHLVIADFETELHRKDGALVEKGQPHFDQSNLQLIKSWLWQVAPLGELDRRHFATMKVGAFKIRV